MEKSIVHVGKRSILLCVVLSIMCMSIIFPSIVSAEAILTSGDWDLATHAIGSNTGKVVTEFDATALADDSSCEIMYLDGKYTPAGYGELAILMRFNPDGFFDARNAGTYEAVNELAWVKGNTYHFKMVTDIPTKKYSVWVTPKGGTETLIAQDYDYRKGGLPMESLGNLVVYTSRGDGNMKIENHVVYPFGHAPASAAAQNTSNPKTGDVSVLPFLGMAAAGAAGLKIFMKKK